MERSPQSRQERTAPRNVGRPRKDAPTRPANDTARRLKNSRYALWKNPEDLTARLTEKLVWIAKTDPRVHRAYLLKEDYGSYSSCPGAGSDRTGAVDLLARRRPSPPS